MQGSTEVLVAGVFLASTVEMVEALTIVLATGTTRGWRSTLEGAATAVAVLALLSLVLGQALVEYVPLQALRLFVGAILLVFGAQWWRKAILRSANLLAKHDEDAIFDREVAELKRTPLREQGRDPVAFTVAFKGVFLEGLEVIVIVITLGSTSHRLGLAAGVAGAAVVMVAGIGIAVSRQLSRVPENAMKMTVALMLISFGSFWSGEGIGVRWPGSDLAIPVLVAIYGLATVAVVAIVRRRNSVAQPAGSTVSSTADAGGAESRQPGRLATRALKAFGMFWWDFLVGDTPELFVGTAAVLLITYFIVDGISHNAPAVFFIPAAVFSMIAISVDRARRLLILKAAS